MEQQADRGHTHVRRSRRPETPLCAIPWRAIRLDVTVEAGGPRRRGAEHPAPENVRPIKGRDIVTITRQEDNQVITLPLPETVYGGEVDAVTGEGQETWKTLTLDGTGKWEAQTTAIPGKFGFTLRTPGIATPENPGIKGDIVCSQYPAVTANDTYQCKSGISVEAQENYYFRIYNDTHAGETADEWKSYLAAQYAAGGHLCKSATSWQSLYRLPRQAHSPSPR